MSETGIPNNRRISVFTFYLADLVYWVGFVAGVTFKTHLSNANFIDLLTLWWKTAFSSEVLFLQNRGLFFELVIFPYFSPNPYTRICVLTIESLSLLGKIVKHHGKLLVRSWFFGFSLIFDFSVHFYKGNRFSWKCLPNFGKLSRNLARIYSGLNLGFMVFTIYLSDLVRTTLGWICSGCNI